ncbi:50S ribosomal protein L35 [Candidatus Dojkabacteria bacterium]|nr:50S ribosomal protein L35 [Candidatus Dojkabacteria bacterium]
MKNKQKTHKASAKRFRVTKTGIVLHNRQKDNAHLKTGKTTKQKARLKGQSGLTNNKEINKIKQLI